MASAPELRDRDNDLHYVINTTASSVIPVDGHDWTNLFGDLARDIARLSVKLAIFDGEVIAADVSGKPEFGLLQDALAAQPTDSALRRALKVLFMNAVSTADPQR